MPRYFFSVIDGQSPIDIVGTELPGLPEVYSEAISCAGELLRDAGHSQRAALDWHMVVTDQIDGIVMTLDFSAHGACSRTSVPCAGRRANRDADAGSSSDPRRRATRRRAYGRIWLSAVAIRCEGSIARRG